MAKFNVGDQVTPSLDTPWVYDEDRLRHPLEPEFGKVYVVRRVKKDDDGDWMLALEGITRDDDDAWWSAGDFSFAKRVVDYSDLLSPKETWVPL